MNYFLLFFLEVEGELLLCGGAFLLGLADEEWAQTLWVEFVDADDGLGELRGEFVAGDEILRLLHHHTHLLQVVAGQAVEAAGVDNKPS